MDEFMPSTKANNRPPRRIALTSGKGGVGKSQVAASLGAVLAGRGIRPLLVDADVGCGNLDVLLGVAPERDLRAVLDGVAIASIVATTGYGGGIDLLAAPSADREELGAGERQALLDAWTGLGAGYDAVLIDTGAGVSANPMAFAAAADVVAVVTSPEPPAIRDAYAAIKVLWQRHRVQRFELIVNAAEHEAAGRRAYGQLASVVARFLPVELGLLAVLPFDADVPRAVRSMRPVSVISPRSPWAVAIARLAARLFPESPVGRAETYLTIGDMR
jgi:flagellar biosynthesis protein FlhG